MSPCAKRTPGRSPAQGGRSPKRQGEGSQGRPPWEAPTCTSAARKVGRKPKGVAWPRSLTARGMCPLNPVHAGSTFSVAAGVNQRPRGRSARGWERSECSSLLRPQRTAEPGNTRPPQADAPRTKRATFNSREGGYYRRGQCRRWTARYYSARRDHFQSYHRRCTHFDWRMQPTKEANPGQGQQSCVPISPRWPGYRHPAWRL